MNIYIKKQNKNLKKKKNKKKGKKKKNYERNIMNILKKK